MLKDKKIRVLFPFCFLACSILAQTHTDSPYSRFGLGQLNPPGFDKGRAMGGTGIGLRDNTQINYLNPASFSVIDTMSSIFDFGVLGTYKDLETNNMNSSYFGGNLDHFAMGIPLTRWWKASVGVLPYSKVGYAIREDTNLVNIGPVNYLYRGNGGINQLYLGTSLEFFDRVSLGVHFKYLFGFINLTQAAEFPLETNYSYPEIINQTLVKDFLIDIGAQYYQSLGEKINFSVGIVFGNKTSLNAEKTVQISNTFPGNTVALNDTTPLSPFFLLEEDFQEGEIVIPAKLGAGFSLEYDNRLILGVDYYQQDWSNATFFGQRDPLTQRRSIHAGMQLIPNPEALRGYYNLISFRLGGHYTDTYLLLKGEQLKDYGISFGVGFPLRGSKSSFNLAFETGRRGTLNNNLILEKYKYLSFSITLHDIWFFKRKFD